MRVWILLLLLLVLPHISQAQDNVCGTAPAPRLSAGGLGRVTPGSPNNMRDSATSSGAKIGEIPGGAVFNVLSEAHCAEGYVWHEVEYNGLTGWTVEGNNNEYWVEPTIHAGEPISANAIDRFAQLQVIPCAVDGVSVKSIALSTDQRFVAFDCVAGETTLYDLISQESVTLESYESDNGLYDLAFSPDNDLLIGRGINYPDDLVMWDIASKGLVNVSEYPARDGFALSSDNTFVAVENSGTLSQIELRSTESFEILETKQIDDGFHIFRGIAISDDGNQIAVTVNYPEIYVWNRLDDSIVTLSAPEHDDYDSTPRPIVFSPSGRFVLTADCSKFVDSRCDETSIEWFNIETSEMVTQWRYPYTGGILSMQFTVDASLLFVTGYQDVFFVDIASDETVYEIPYEMDVNPNVPSLMSLDGSIVFIGTNHGLQLWGIPE